MFPRAIQANCTILEERRSELDAIQARQCFTKRAGVRSLLFEHPLNRAPLGVDPLSGLILE